MQSITIILLLAVVTLSTQISAQDTTHLRKNRNVEIGIRSSNYSGYGIYYSRYYNSFKPRITLGVWSPDFVENNYFTSETNKSVGIDVMFPVYAFNRFEYSITIGAMYEYNAKSSSGDLVPFDTVQILYSSSYQYKNIRSGVTNGIGINVGRFRFGAELGINCSFTHSKTIGNFLFPSEKRVIDETPFGKPTFDVGYGLSVGYNF